MLDWMASVIVSAVSLTYFKSVRICIMGLWCLRASIYNASMIACSSPRLTVWACHSRLVSLIHMGIGGFCEKSIMVDAHQHLRMVGMPVLLPPDASVYITISDQVGMSPTVWSMLCGCL